MIEKHRKRLLLALFSWRICNALATRTFFQADEFWQALEPAHFKAFGYGELTWEWQKGLRSYGFPLLMEIAYRIALLVSRVSRCWLGQNRADLVEYYGVILLPKIMMSLIAAIGEYYTVLFVQKLCRLCFDKTGDKKPHDSWQVEKLAIILTATNFFNCFLITRTFINSFEMSLTSAALYYWDWSGGNEIFTANFTKSLCVAIFACLQRPTNGLIWMVLGFRLLWGLNSQRKYAQVFWLLGKITIWFVIIFSINTTIDYYFYDRLIFPPLNFLQFNVLSPLSTFYGANQWHFHLTQSLPLMLNYTLPLFFLGLTYGSYSDVFLQIKMVIGVNLVVYSLLSHKEFRFIYPLQPLLTLISTYGALRLQENCSWKHLFLVLAPVGSITAALFLNWNHESGTIAVIKYLHNRPLLDSVGFVMPCHSTPWQSYLHRDDIKGIWAITCDPPLHLMQDPLAAIKLPYYMDESDILYNDISKFMDHNFPPLNDSTPQNYRHDWPQLLVCFQHLEEAYVKEHLKDNAYVEETRFFNSLVHWDSRRKGDVVVYRKL